LQSEAARRVAAGPVWHAQVDERVAVAVHIDARDADEVARHVRTQSRRRMWEQDRTHLEDSPLVHRRCRERVQKVACPKSALLEKQLWRKGLHARLARLQSEFHSLAVGERLHHNQARVHVLAAVGSEHALFARRVLASRVQARLRDSNDEALLVPLERVEECVEASLLLWNSVHGRRESSGSARPPLYATRAHQEGSASSSTTAL